MTVKSIEDRLAERAYECAKYDADRLVNSLPGVGNMEISKTLIGPSPDNPNMLRIDSYFVYQALTAAITKVLRDQYLERDIERLLNRFSKDETVPLWPPRDVPETNENMVD